MLETWRLGEFARKNFSARDAAEILEKKEAIKQRKVKFLRSRIDVRIRRKSQQGETKCTYVVPIMVLGHGAYDRGDMAQRLAESLCRDGYRVRISRKQPGLLTISWSHQVIKDSSSSKVTFSGLDGARRMRQMLEYNRTA